jgi:hypothetical protein
MGVGGGKRRKYSLASVLYWALFCLRLNAYSRGMKAKKKKKMKLYSIEMNKRHVLVLQVPAEISKDPHDKV